MKIIKIENIAKNTTPSVMTIGVFDGVHLGHQFVLQQLAQHTSLQKVLLSFENHPVTFLKQKPNIDLVLTPLEEKIQRLKALHIIDILYLLPFDENIALLSAEDFLKKYVFPYFNPKIFLLGHDNRFGKDQQGGSEILQSLSQKYAMQVEALQPLLIDNTLCSSTTIRHCLKSGNIPKANYFLGYDYTLEGTVVHGQALGRTIGFPTANMQLSCIEKLIPQKGVYATTIHIEGFENPFFAMTNIGTKPTVEENHTLCIETHIFEFEEMIYDKKIEVSFHQFIREEQKFDSLQKLVEQLDKDKEKCLNFFQQ